MALSTADSAATTLLAELDPDDVPASYQPLGLDRLSDARLCELVSEIVSRPKAAPADSFVLHAPLELLARSALLPLVEPWAREQARQRLVWLGATYAAAGDEVDQPASCSYPSVERAATDLGEAVEVGDLDGADRAAGWLAAAASPTELSRALAECVLPCLSAAGHGPIMLFLLPRVAPRSTLATNMVRGLVRELARHPDWRLSWHRQRDRHWHVHGSVMPSRDLVAALRCPPSPGDPGTTFIHPTMSLVERSGLAAELLDDVTRGVTVAQTTRDLLRVAAWSMLQDDPYHAPYGWTHCLTMPQAALGIAGVGGIPESGADPDDAIAVAATYVLGFRSTLGSVDLDPGWAPEPALTDDPLGWLMASPPEAAAAVWHAPESSVPALVARLVTNAAVHPDAHLAKYTLACLDATVSDPGAGRLYLAAAAFLGAWWAEHPVAGDPLLT